MSGRRRRRNTISIEGRSIERQGRARSIGGDWSIVIHEQQGRRSGEGSGCPAEVTSNKSPRSKHGDDQDGMPGVEVTSTSSSGVVFVVDETKEGAEDGKNFTGDSNLVGHGSRDLSGEELIQSTRDTEGGGSNDFNNDTRHGFSVVGHLVLVEESVEQVRDHGEKAEGNNTNTVEAFHLIGRSSLRDVRGEPDVGVAEDGVRGTTHDHGGEEAHAVADEGDGAEGATLSGVDEDVVDAEEGQDHACAHQHGGEHGVTTNSGRAVRTDGTVSLVVEEHGEEIFIDRFTSDVSFSSDDTIVFNRSTSDGMFESMFLDRDRRGRRFFRVFCFFLFSSSSR